MLDLHGDLEALLAEAQRRAEQRALEREAAAARRAEELLAIADADAERTLRERRSRTEAGVAALRERVLALGEMSAQRAALTRREALLSSVWEAARARLEVCASDPDRYLPALRGLARMAARTLPSEEIELASDARGQALLTPERLAAWGREDGVRYTLAAAPARLAGGLEGRAGRLRFDGSFETRLQQAEQALREDVAAWLLAGAEPAERPEPSAPA
ncbi:MAG TPA: V-type ATP synthase subunit E family protein [Trueperaceae bacterium]|nr:V-type ATP synthase subunit E family protein [Trueperaceae bacterium]